MHGVINTDNVSILGLTIDYGPYAFMDVFESGKICNHSDDAGRYSYKLQPTMIIFALRCLLSALAPVIGAEKSRGKAVQAEWSKGISKEQLSEWTNAGLEIQERVESETMSTFLGEYNRLMRKVWHILDVPCSGNSYHSMQRLGLRKEKDDDFKTVISPLLDLLERKELDYHSTFRHLCRFRPDFLQQEHNVELQALLDDINITSQCSKEAKEQANEEWRKWLATYAQRIEEEQEEWARNASDEWFKLRRREMEATNPRFVLRQWLLEEVIAKVEKDPLTGRRVLAKVMEASVHTSRDDANTE